MKFPLISMSNFPNIYHFTVNTHCMHFLPGAPLTASSGAFIFVTQTGFAEICFSIILSPANRKKGDISFSRKIYKLALALVSGTWSKVFQFTQFTMGCECQSKLQICSSERNVPLLPVNWKTISKRMMSANPVCGTNLKAPEPAVKGTPQKQLRIP